MDIYLPIAGLAVNALLMIALGGLVGLLSGMFGVGGGFLTTPLLIFYGIPPTVAVASATTQITGASVSGVHAHWRRGGVDLKMGAVMIVGGSVGSLVGAVLFRWLQASGQIDLIIGFLYVLLLGVGGGFILVPAMIYLLAMAPRVVVGTSLVMVLAVSAFATMVHSMTTQAVDIVLAALLLIGGVVGAQYGAKLATRLKPDLLRLALAVIILLVALRMALGLAWRPDEIYTVTFL